MYVVFLSPILARWNPIVLSIRRKYRAKDFDRNFVNMKKVLYRHLFSKVLGLSLLLFSISSYAQEEAAAEVVAEASGGDAAKENSSSIRTVRLVTHWTVR